MVSTKNKDYSDSLKLNAIKDYLDRKGFLRNICCIYEISSLRVIRDWIKNYNGHKIIKSHNKQGDIIMTNGRKTTYKEIIEIVAFRISNNDVYQSTVDKLSTQLKLIDAKKDV